jgi:hypothetical protein
MVDAVAVIQPPATLPAQKVIQEASVDDQLPRSVLVSLQLKEVMPSLPAACIEHVGLDSEDGNASLAWQLLGTVSFDIVLYYSQRVLCLSLALWLPSWTN